MHRARPHFAAVIAAVVLFAVTPAARAAEDPARPRQWGLELIRAPQAWSVGRGAGTTIAVIDTGVDLPHEDLASKLLPGRSFVAQPVQDENGHGTHVAGIAAAATDNGKGIASVAPDAKILPLRVFEPDNRASYENIARAIRYAADQRATVVNLSIGPELPLIANTLDHSLLDAIEYAWAKGSVVAIASGNEAIPVSEYGNLPAIVVAAVDRDDRVASYSTAVGGAMWSMAAPGGDGRIAEDGILSTYWYKDGSNSYAFAAGTSMAAPHVAGAAAVLRGLGLSPQQTVDRLLATAKDLGPRGKDNDYGSGRLDLAAAVAGLSPAPTTATTASGAPSKTPGGATGARTPPTAAPPTVPPGPDGAPLPTTPASATPTPAGDDFTPIELEETDEADVDEVSEVAGSPAGDGSDVPWMPVALAAVLLAAVTALSVRRLRRAP